MLLTIDTYYYLMNHEKDENSNGQHIVVTQNGKNPASGTPNDRIPDLEQKSSIVTAKIEPIPFFPNAVGNPPHVIKEIKSTVSKINVDLKLSFLFLNRFF